MISDEGKPKQTTQTKLRSQYKDCDGKRGKVQWTNSGSFGLSLYSIFACIVYSTIAVTYNKNIAILKKNYNQFLKNITK